jgi:hypothetical protein
MCTILKISTGILVLFWGLNGVTRCAAQSNPVLSYARENVETGTTILTADRPNHTTADPSGSPYVPPYIRNLNSAPRPSIEWGGVVKDSLQFLAVMSAFRVVTEPPTRDALSNPFFPGYVEAVSSLHGWDDGDEFYVNYIGHPMQGAVSSFIWSNHDRAYNRDPIGWNSNYVKSKLRAATYAFALSAVSEIGPVSEASIGQIQRYHPAQGFVDYVITPTLGVMWSVGEDAIDDSLVRHIEDHTSNTTLKILARCGLNPARSFANAMGRKYPWYRTNRSAPSSAASSLYYERLPKKPVTPPPGVPPFQFNVDFETRTYWGKNASGPCIGGGGELAFRVARNWQLVGEVSGCKQTGLPPNTTGDALTYVVGPQWSSRLSSRWVTHARVLVGGNKIVQQMELQELKGTLEQKYNDQYVFPPLADQYNREFDSNALAIVTGAGIDYKLNKALQFRSSAYYSHTWNRDIGGVKYQNDVRFSSGLVLDIGTW